MHRQRSENHDAQRQRSERKYLNLKDRWIYFCWVLLIRWRPMNRWISKEELEYLVDSWFQFDIVCLLQSGRRGGPMVVPAGFIFAEFYWFDGDLWTDEYQKKSFSTWLISIWYGLFVTVRPRANGCSGPDQTWFFSMGSRNKRFLAWVTKAKTGSTIAFVLFARGLRPGKTSAGWAGFGFSKRQITLHFERLPIFFIYHHQNQNHQNLVRKPIKCL